MNARHAAFALLRRIAFQDLRPVPRNVLASKTPVSRALHYRATAPLRNAETSSNSFQIPRPAGAKNETAEKSSGRDQPAYEMTFTCKPCGERSTHRITKQGYHRGSVLITCPGCSNRHVISDHLNIFGDRSLTIEDLMQEQGQLVKKGSLSEDGDLEFWSDGTTTARATPGKADDKAS